MKRNELTDFKILLASTQSISDIEYQKRIWVNHEDPEIVDSYDDTTLYFLGDSQIVLDAAREGSVKMTEEQFHTLKSLYERVDEYDSLEERPDRDAEIVEDPHWLEIVAYAKEVYPILSAELP